MTLLLEILVPNISGELCWGIMSNILSMPVMHSAQVSSLSLFKEKRGFRISAIIVGLVATAAVAASVTVSALALYATVQTTQTIK